MNEKKRTQTMSTGFTNMRPNFGARSIQSASSMANMMSPPISNLGSRLETPYQVYKMAKKNKRKIFTNQLVPSKSKIATGVSTPHFEDLKGMKKIGKPIQIRNKYDPFNFQVKHEKNFLDILGKIDPKLKEKTLLNFKRINIIRSQGSEALAKAKIKGKRIIFNTVNLYEN